MVPERAHAMCAAADPLAEFVADASLWGELAGSASLRDAFAGARVELRGLLGDNAMS
jgi:D-arabinitol 4-dehydrogenase